MQIGQIFHSTDEVKEKVQQYAKEINFKSCNKVVLKFLFSFGCRFLFLGLAFFGFDGVEHHREKRSLALQLY